MEGCRVRIRVAPTFSAGKGIFEAILRWKSVNVRPTRCGRRCLHPNAPVQFHRCAFNYGGPLRKSGQIKDGTSFSLARRTGEGVRRTGEGRHWHKRRINSTSAVPDYAGPRPVVVFRPEDNAAPPGAYRTATAKTEEFLARHPDAPLHQPDFYAAYFAELYSLVGRDSAEADPVFAASKAFDFPKAATECRLVGDDTRSVLVQWRDGEELIAKLRREKHLSPQEWRPVQRFSVNLHVGEFLQGQVRGYLVEAIEGVWFWNSHYDSDLGACHTDEFTL